MKQLMQKVKNIREHLQDETSKFIFDNRLLFLLTGDWKYISNITSNLPEKGEMDKAIGKCKQHINQLVVYGVGKNFELISKLYPDFEFKLLCDRSLEKQKTGYKGIPIMSPEELLKQKELYVAICTSQGCQEIQEYLLENNYEKEKIINLGAVIESLQSRQYFDLDIMKPEREEIFVDGGCFDCATDLNFIKWCGGNYKKIYAFEADKVNYERCLEKYEKESICNMCVINKGLWECETVLSFSGGLGSGGCISEFGDPEKILAVPLDYVVGNDKVTFIKFDIEGSELEALRGGAQTIIDNHPKMAICIYHKPEDVIEIASYILSLHNDYKMYIRHYWFNGCETVLYAI